MNDKQNNLHLHDTEKKLNCVGHVYASVENVACKGTLSLFGAMQYPEGLGMDSYFITPIRLTPACLSVRSSVPPVLRLICRSLHTFNERH